jgi:hypothetical protein
MEGSRKMAMTSFLRFQGSRPGHFKELRTGEASPLRCSPSPSGREPGGPPFRNSTEMTKASRQSLRKHVVAILL